MTDRDRANDLRIYIKGIQKELRSVNLSKGKNKELSIKVLNHFAKRIHASAKDWMQSKGIEDGFRIKMSL